MNINSIRNLKPSSMPGSALSTYARLVIAEYQGMIRDFTGDVGRRDSDQELPCYAYDCLGYWGVVMNVPKP